MSGGGGVSSFFPFNQERLPGGGQIQAVWSRPSPPPRPGLSPVLTLTQLLHWQPLCPGSGQMHRWWPPFLQGPRATRHQLVVQGVLRTKGLPGNRTGASAPLIGSEAPSERWPRRKPGPQRSTHHPRCFWHRRWGGRRAPPPLLTRACSSLVPRPEREASALLAAGLATSQGVATGWRLLRWGLSVLKPGGQGGGLCLRPGMQGGP